MLMAARIVLTLLTVLMLWPSARLTIAAFKRSQPPMAIIKEAALYTVILLVIRWLYRKCSKERT